MKRVNCDIALLGSESLVMRTVVEVKVNPVKRDNTLLLQFL